MVKYIVLTLVRNIALPTMIFATLVGGLSLIVSNPDYRFVMLIIGSLLGTLVGSIGGSRSGYLIASRYADRDYQRWQQEIKEKPYGYS